MKKKSFLIKIAILLLSASLLGSAAFVRPLRASSNRDLEIMQNFLNYDEVSQEDVDSKKKERDKALQDAANYSMQAEALRTEEGELKGELSKLNGLSEEQNKQYQEISMQLAAAQLEKAEALNEYVKSQENLKDTKEMFSNRVAVMFEYQNKSTLEVLLESENLAGFFTNIEMISLIAEADDQAVDKMQIAMDEAKLASENALKQAEEMEDIAEEKASQLKELEGRIGKTEKALEDVSTKIATADQNEMALENYAASLDSQILDLQNQLYAQQQAEEAAERAEEAQRNAETAPAETVPPETVPPETVPSDTLPSETTASGSSSEETVPAETEAVATATPTPTPAPTATPVPVDNSHRGTLSWPTWCTTITSPFGWREHPVYHDYRYHSGIDIGAGMGDAVMAAKGGTVIEVSLPCPGENTGGDGYGNYIVVDHGDGISTLYAHLRNAYVSTGDYVSSGQQIGEVGSTGTSTAAHLHFEVRVYGERVDPTSYLP